MSGAGAAQRFESGLVVAGLKQRQAEIQVDIRETPGSSFSDGLEFLGGVGESLVAKRE